MRTLLAFLLTALLGLSAFASAPATESLPLPSLAPTTPASFTIDKAHSSVGFRIRHLGLSNVRGTFSEYDASVRLDPADLRTLQVTATIQVASINTENTRRDDHLRSDDFFEAERFPTMRFVSTGVRSVDGDRFELEGDLTIRDVTRRVVLDGELVGVGTGPRGDQRVGIEATTTIDRHDFGLTWNRVTEAGGVVAAREVQISLDIQAIRQES
jgi:polyisoprenoid-binding protein YceI